MVVENHKPRPVLSISIYHTPSLSKGREGVYIYCRKEIVCLIGKPPPRLASAGGKLENRDFPRPDPTVFSQVVAPESHQTELRGPFVSRRGRDEAETQSHRDSLVR